MPGSLRILVSLFIVFGNLGLRDFLYDGFCLQGKTDKTFKNVNKHFPNFVGQTQRKTKMG